MDKVIPNTTQMGAIAGATCNSFAKTKKKEGKVSRKKRRYVEEKQRRELKRARKRKERKRKLKSEM
jgi:predicted phosphoribosyltransferase